MPKSPLDRYRTPGQRVLDKVIHHIDEHCAAFIALSPFATLATASPEGEPDVSPRGGDPDPCTCSTGTGWRCPTGRRNNPVDSLRTLAANPRAALMFFVPGIDETLRVYRDDDAARSRRARHRLHRVRPAAAVGAGAARAEGVLSSARSRSCVSGLWDPERRWSARPFPPLSQVLRDHCDDATIPDEGHPPADLALEL